MTDLQTARANLDAVSAAFDAAEAVTAQLNYQFRAGNWTDEARTEANKSRDLYCARNRAMQAVRAFGVQP